MIAQLDLPNLRTTWHQNAQLAHMLSPPCYKGGEHLCTWAPLGQRSLGNRIRDALDLAGYETWNWQTLARGERTEIRFAWACRCGADRIEAIEFHRDFVESEECIGLLLTDMEEHEHVDRTTA